jgi:hypothetical protein
MNLEFSFSVFFFKRESTLIINPVSSSEFWVTYSMSNLEYLNFFEYKVIVLSASRRMLCVMGKLLQFSVSSVHHICPWESQLCNNEWRLNLLLTLLLINLNLLVLGKTVFIVCWLFHHGICASLCSWT